MRRIITLGAALALASAALVAPVTSNATAAPTATHAKKKADKVSTNFAFRGGGYGAALRGGDLPANVGTIAYQSIGCTNLAGLHRHNEVADVEIPGLGTVAGIRTDVETVQNGSETATISRHRVAEITLAESSFGRLSIEGVTAYAKAAATPSGFQAEVETTLAKLAFTRPNGQKMQLPLPTPGRPIEVPGLLRVAIGDHREVERSDFAKARANALKITLIPTNTRVTLGRASAQITNGIKSGLFSGSANTTSTQLLGNLVSTGRTQLVTMPCQGTGGVVKSNDAVGLNLPGILQLGAVTSRQMGQQEAKKAYGFEEAGVASVNLGNGALVIDAVKGRVNVTREKGKNRKVNFDGSQVLGITVDGETYGLPEIDGLEIPGIAKIETMVKEKFKNGGSITALRLTLLDGTGAVVNIGQATLKIWKKPR